MSKASKDRRNVLPATRVGQVLAEIGNEHLTLVNGKGYWYFIYDDEAKGLYDTKSVYTMRLSDLSVNDWAADGRELVAKMEQSNG